MLRVIRMIIARKCVEGKAPLVATGMEVHRVTGLTIAEQVAAVEALGDKVITGRTLTDVYYKLRER